MCTKWIIGIVSGIVLIGVSAAIGSPPVATSIPTPLTEATVNIALSVHTKGDIDCDGDADAVDALTILRHVVALPVNLPADCPPIGSSPPTPTKGDIDCDGDADAVDALTILRHVVALPVNLPADCPPIGSSPPTPTPRPTPTKDPAPALSAMIKQVRPAVVRIQTSSRMGSGVIFETQGRTGYVVTNHHVVEGDVQVSVTVNDSTTYSGSVLGTDSVRDLAVVSICCGSFQTLPFGNAAALQPGDEVVVIGYALNFRGQATVTRGIVSAVRYDSAHRRDLIQTDAAINPGNSGGPLLSMWGKILGINTGRVEESPSGRPTEGLGFAISGTTVQQQIPTLRAGPPAPTPTASPTPGASPSPTPTPTATPGGTPPDQVTGLEAIPGGASGKITLVWNPILGQDVDHYNIWRGTASGGLYPFVASVPVGLTLYTNSDLEPGTTYCYVVTAVNSSGNVGLPADEACSEPTQ